MRSISDLLAEAPPQGKLLPQQLCAHFSDRYVRCRGSAGQSNCTAQALPTGGVQPVLCLPPELRGAAAYTGRRWKTIAASVALSMDASCLQENQKSESSRNHAGSALPWLLLAGFALTHFSERLTVLLVAHCIIVMHVQMMRVSAHPVLCPPPELRVASVQTQLVLAHCNAVMQLQVKVA